MSKIPHIIQFLQDTGRIAETKNLFDADNPLVNFADNGKEPFHISVWRLSEPQPTPGELLAIENSQEFKDYLLNKKPKETVEERLDKLLAEFNTLKKDVEDLKKK